MSENGRIIVTGGAGFIGSAIVWRLNEIGRDNILIVDRLDEKIEVPGYGTVPYSIAFGGNFYAMVELDAVGLPFDRARQQDILDAGLAIMEAINTTAPPKHPLISGTDHCHHVEFIAPGC